MSSAAAGDLVMLVAEDRKQFIIKLEAGAEFQTHHGILTHDDMIGSTFGARLESHLGHRFHLLQPTLRDLLLSTKRRSQIIFPKDIGYILLRLSVKAGDRVLEAGTGSGALTLALAWAVGTDGRVLSVDRRPDMQRLAAENLDRIGIGDRVTFLETDVRQALDIDAVDSLFLDLPSAEQALEPALRWLRPGGTFGAILPTANQVSDLLAAMEDVGFTDVDVCEILLRFYKTVPARLRPADRMVAHTGYLVFGRPVERTAVDAVA
jgi:tRNA (adenine57-N1/adenine58-N1)-methyltransferase